MKNNEMVERDFEKVADSAAKACARIHELELNQKVYVFVDLDKEEGSYALDSNLTDDMLHSNKHKVWTYDPKLNNDYHSPIIKKTMMDFYMNL